MIVHFMEILRRIVRALGLGSLAALAALALDEVMAFLTRGHWIPLYLHSAAAAVLLGALAAGLLEGGLLALRRPRWTVPRTLAGLVVVLYALSICERFHQAMASRLQTPLVIVAILVVLAGYAAWIVVLRHVSGAWVPALALTALAAAAGLAVNRNLFDRPLELPALVADVVILVAAVILARVVHAAGAKRVGVSVAAVALTAILAVTVASRPGPPAATSPAPPAHPHLILISLDTLRQDVFASVVDETPEGRAFRDALGGGAWFDNAIASSPWTAPSIGSIMTGLYPQEHGLKGSGTKDRSRPLTRLSKSVPTLAQRLRDSGFLTAAIVTNPLLHPFSGIARGFEHYEILEGPTVKLPLLTVLRRFRWLEPDHYQPAASVRRRLRHRLASLSGDGRPVFLWLHLMDPHQPLHPHRDLAPDSAATGLSDDERLYRDEVRYTLRETGLLFEQLKAHWLWDHAAVVLVSDHGEMFPADGHDRLPIDKPRPEGHGHALYGELVRVPLVIRPPGWTSHRRLDVLASHTDLHDTLGDLLGVGFPRIAGDRMSLVPWLSGEPSAEKLAERSHVLMGGIQSGPRQRGLRTDSLKLIHYPAGELPDELYELASDSAEQRDVAAEQPRRLEEARRLLAASWGQLREAPDAEAPVIDEETRRRLKALGYVE